VQPAALARLERDQRRMLGGAARGLALRDRRAGDAMDLERALDPLRVARRDARGRDRIDVAQLGVQRRPAFCDARRSSSARIAGSAAGISSMPSNSALK
jgi:hypothetical protein